MNTLSGFDFISKKMVLLFILVNIYNVGFGQSYPLKVSPPPRDSPPLCPNNTITLKAVNADNSDVIHTSGYRYSWQYCIERWDVTKVFSPSCVRDCETRSHTLDCVIKCPLVDDFTWHDLSTTETPSCEFIPVNTIFINKDLSTQVTDVFFRVQRYIGRVGDYGEQKSKAFIFEKYKAPPGLREGVVLKPICNDGSDGSITVTTTGDTVENVYLQ